MGGHDADPAAACRRVAAVNVRLPTDTGLPIRHGAWPGLAPGRHAAKAVASQPISEDRTMSNKNQEFPQSYGRNHPAKHPQQDAQVVAKGGKDVDGPESGKPKVVPTPNAATDSAKLPAGAATPVHAGGTAPSGESAAKPSNSAARGNDDVMSTPAKQV
jgi:hypothetical protein